jgi:hypothetical protein
MISCADSGRSGPAILHRIPVTLALLLTTSLASADFESAAEAYRDKDYVSAYRQFLPLANAGDARAQTVLALMYKYGESVPEDPAKAFEWYMKAAESGYAPALFSVGEMYAEGLGVEQDEEAAIQWLTRAAEAGFQRANDLLSSLGASRVVDGKQVDESVPWSQRWNFRLPNQIRNQPVARDDSAPVTDASTYFHVQLGAMGTRAGANRLWEWLTAQDPGLFEDIEPIIRLSENSERRVYRVQAGPFDGFQAARSFCEKLQRRIETDCLPLRQ